MPSALPFLWLTPDGLRIFGQHWRVHQPSAVVCLVHGLGEHCGRYAHVADFFLNKDIATLAYDRRGHGQSEGQRGHTPGYSFLLDEIMELLNRAGWEHPDVPVFLYGHSMGGNLVLNYVLQRNPAIAGVIATGPLIRLPKTPALPLVALAKFMNSVFPAFTQGNGIAASAISSDPAVVRAYLADPLVHNRISARMGLSLLKAGHFLDRFQGKMPVPALVMHGLADTITSAAGSRQFFRRVQGDVTWREWPGLKHEIHNEPAQKEVLQVIATWIEAHCAVSK